MHSAANYINLKVENWLLRCPAEELTEETDKVDVKETTGNSTSTELAGQGTQQSTSAKEPVPGRVGLQASFMPPNLPLFKEVNPIYVL